jgi:hypothetical protein
MSTLRCSSFVTGSWAAAMPGPKSSMSPDSTPWRSSRVSAARAASGLS